MSELQAHQIRQLRKHVHELLHWIYPVEGDPDNHRTEHFVEEAMIGYLLLGEPHPMANAEHIELVARKAIARPEEPPDPDTPGTKP
jgi:hypothetical protein